MTKRFDIATEGVTSGRKSMAVMGLRWWQQVVEALRGYILQLAGINSTVVQSIADITDVYLMPALYNTIKIKPVRTTIKLSKQDSMSLALSPVNTTLASKPTSTTLQLVSDRSVILIEPVGITTVDISPDLSIVKLPAVDSTILQLS